VLKMFARGHNSHQVSNTKKIKLKKGMNKQNS